MASRRSIAPSQITSGQMTPQEDHADFSNLVSPLFSSHLKERLQLLDPKEGKEGHNFNKNRFVHSIEVLSEDRRKVSVLQREQALGMLLTDMATKYDPDIINYDLFSTIVQSFLQARSTVEASTALQLTVVALTFIDDEDTHASSCLELVQQLSSNLRKRITEEKNPELLSAMITACSVLTYFLNAGGGGYGMEKEVGWFLEIAEGLGEKEAVAVSASISGAALLLTLCSTGSVHEIASEWLPTLEVLLNSSQVQPRMATSKFIAVMVEGSDPSFLKSEEVEEQMDEIKNTLESISQQSVQRTAKRDKKVQNLLIKSVLKQCNIATEPEKEDGDEDEEAVDLVPQFLKNTISKNLGISTWDALVVLDHLTWVFGPGLHTQLANNIFVRQLLKKEDVYIQHSEQPIFYEQEKQFKSNEPRKVDEAKRSQQMRKQQLRKVEDRNLID